MPNYNLTINSTFNPFSFEEMLQPIIIAQNAHREVEDAYTDLSIKAGEFEALAESEKLRNGANSNTYKRYSTYANDLKKQADELATKGLKSGTRKSLMDLKTRYSTDIKPIQEAKEKLKTLVDERKKFEIASPTLKYERDYSDIGVDELLDNPNLTFGRTYTGSLIEEQVGKSASALLKQIRTDPKYSKILGGQYFQSKIQQGYTMEEVLLAAAEDPKAPKELSDLMNSAIINSGVKDWEGMYDSNGDLTARGKAVIEDVKSYAARGLNYAVGTTTYNTLSNKAYDYAAQAALQREARQQAQEAPAPVLHWDIKTEKSSAEVVDKYRNILNKLMVQNADGSYSLKPGKDGKLYNPMAIYEETLQYAKENPHKTRTTSVPNRSFGSITFTRDDTDSNAAKVIGEKYGTTVLTDEEYNLLKELGYSSSTMNVGFSSLPSSINSKISTYRPTDFNMANYSNVGTKIYGKLNEDVFKEDNIINVYEGKGIGKQAKYSDLFDEETGKPLHDITSIAYSIQNKDRLLIEAGGNRYSINVGVLPVEIQNIINDWAQLLPTATLQEQGIIQDNIAYLIRDVFNSYDKVASETSSKR